MLNIDEHMGDHIARAHEHGTTTKHIHHTILTCDVVRKRIPGIAFVLSHMTTQTVAIRVRTISCACPIKLHIIYMYGKMLRNSI